MEVNVFEQVKTFDESPLACKKPCKEGNNPTSNGNNNFKMKMEERR